MDKKKKQQYIILGVLGLVVVVVAIINLPTLFGGGAAAPTPVEGTPPPPGGQPPAPQPGQPGQPAAPKPEDDLKPIVFVPPVIGTVAYQPGAYDPLKVLNSDIVDDRRAEEVETLRKDWVLKGITSRMYELRGANNEPIYDDDGRVRMIRVYEAFFDGKPYSYKVGDRLLPGTRFKITRIVHNHEGATVEVTSDTGATQRLRIASFEPYPDGK